MKNQAYFVSDLHLGTDFDGVYPNREDHLCDFLEGIQTTASHLFILGDLFEFWMEYRFYIPKMHFRLLTTLRKMTDAGVMVHYLSGNHDFNLGLFFSNELRVHTHHHPLQINVQGKNLYLFHGDGMAANDHKYRLVKKVLIHPLSNWAFKLIHPDWGMALARWVGQQSRRNHKPSDKNTYRTTSEKILAREDVDLVIHGHTHHHFSDKSDMGVYANSGEWLQKLLYLKMEEGELTTHSYEPKEKH